MTILLIFIFYINSLLAKVILPENYHSVVEGLIYFKDDTFKVYFGGPIENGTGVKWLMPVVFKDTNNKIRAVYEISFINCLPHSLKQKEIELLYIKLSDIDIKFKNISSEGYLIFDRLINNANSYKEYILIREVDVSNVCYPDIFIESIYADRKIEDRGVILNFLQKKFCIQQKLNELTPPIQFSSTNFNENFEGLLEQKQVQVMLQEKSYFFTVEHYHICNDPWKSYYIVYYGSPSDHNSAKGDVFLRLDSGCTSGQIYNDSSCDCLDQLHSALFKLVEARNTRSFLIHIPTHDGRGFGVAPKSETEIYKRGGSGRLNSTSSLNTIQAAKLLYNTENFDIRTYDGCAKLLKLRNISQVNLITDNKSKVKSLVDNGITVNRVKTNTTKMSCITHINAKKESVQYFTD